MSLFVTSIASGSNGNCYYIGNEQEAVLVDVGISCREIERRMARLCLSMQRVKAIFVSHEHSDHIKGLYRLSAKFNLPVYVSRATFAATGLDIPAERLVLFQASAPLSIGSLQVIPFSKYHDAADPYSFIIEQDGIRIGVFTDLGRVCEQLIHHFRQCHVAFLETNYDDELLDKGRYPYFLKNRIRGGYGHLSNRQALDLFLNHRHNQLSHLFLSHLSRENNSPELVYQLFQEHAHNTQIIVTSRHEESPLLTMFSLGKNLLISHPLS